MARQESLARRAYELALQLGLDRYGIEAYRNVDYIMLFERNGAKTWCERDRIHDQPETKDMPLIVPGAQLVVTSERPDGEIMVLVQVRENGEKEESKKQIGFPGGACNMWEYEGKRQLEHPVLTAYREFQEEVGFPLTSSIHYFCNVTTTNHYKGYPDAYAFSMYYICKVDYQHMLSIGDSSGTAEGKIKIVPVSDLINYNWFPDAEEAFNLLVRSYNIKKRMKRKKSNNEQ